MILQDPTLLRSALAAALEAARASDAGQQALPLPAPPEPPPLSPAAARRAAAAARIHQAPRTAPAGTGARASSPRRRSGPRITDLHDLGAVARQLREEQARLEAQAKERRAAAARREAEHQLFSRAVGAIRPLRTRERLHLSDPPPLPLPVQHALFVQPVLHRQRWYRLGRGVNQVAAAQRGDGADREAK